MAASTARHETRALLRAHLAASTGYRHVTRHCPICHRLLRLAMEPEAETKTEREPERPAKATGPTGTAAEAAETAEAESPSPS